MSQPFELFTKQGYIIVDTYEYLKRKYIIAYRQTAKDYFIGYGYDASSGQWAQGVYGYTFRSHAQKALIDYLHTI